VTDAIFVQDIKTGKFIDINQRALDTFGYGREELLDMGFHDLSENKPPYTVVEAQSRTQLAVGGKPQTFEWRQVGWPSADTQIRLYGLRSGPINQKTKHYQYFIH
jgi:PAS domain S-box-containing protein